MDEIDELQRQINTHRSDIQTRKTKITTLQTELLPLQAELKQIKQTKYPGVPATKDLLNEIYKKYPKLQRIHLINKEILALTRNVNTLTELNKQLNATLSTKLAIEQRKKPPIKASPSPLPPKKPEINLEEQLKTRLEPSFNVSQADLDRARARSPTSWRDFEEGSDDNSKEDEDAELEKAEALRLETEKAEADKLAEALRLEQGRLAEAEKLAEETRLAAERAEQDRLAAQNAEEARIATEREEEAKRDAEMAAEQVRLAAEREEEARKDADIAAEDARNAAIMNAEQKLKKDALNKMFYKEEKKARRDAKTQQKREAKMARRTAKREAKERKAEVERIANGKKFRTTLNQTKKNVKPMSTNPNIICKAILKSGKNLTKKYYVPSQFPNLTKLKPIGKTKAEEPKK